MPSGPDQSSIELAARLNAHAELATILSTTRLSPSITEVIIKGDHHLVGPPGSDVMIRVVDAKGRYVRRRYSVRRVDETSESFALWIVTSHEGPGSTWASSARTGDLVDVVGPRGKITLDPLADWHLFVGDTSGLAAFYRMAQSIETPGRAIFIVEVATMDDALTAPFDEGLGVTGIFVDRTSRPHDDASGLLDGLSAFALPPDVGHAYVFGEFHVMRAIEVALRDRGLDEHQISTKAFWRTGRHNAEMGEPEKDL